jgi:Zn-dependent M28 family amino/carboxypeptidase
MSGTFIALAAVCLIALAGSARAAGETEASDREKRLRASVEILATSIGERHTRRPEALRQAEQWIGDQLGQTGLTVKREAFAADGQDVANVYVELMGRAQPDEWIIVGAHYDGVRGCPAANDNGSGVAALLELAQALGKTPRARSIRFIAFVNEEPPFFQGPLMGSVVHARGCKARDERVAGMICLETIGCFSDEPSSQQFPPGLQERYPTTGNFIAIVGNPPSAPLAAQVLEHFRRATDLPAELAVLPPDVPGVGWSDHWAFWQEQYPALMFTDTAPFRYPHYHQASDTPDKIDFARMMKVVEGAEAAIKALAGPEASR